MGVYNSISNVRRIAFIDGLTDTRAEELSIQYPFAICYASENENDDSSSLKWLPGFWKAGKRYGIQNVDTNPVILNGYGISLMVESGTLKLISSQHSTPVRSIRVTPNNLSLSLNEQYRLEVIFTPSDATNKSVTWTSSNPDKVSVNQNGLVKANGITVQNEYVTITATSVEGNFSDVCIVSVHNTVNELLYYIGTAQFTSGSSITINDTDFASSVGSSGWHKMSDQTLRSNNYYAYENGEYTGASYTVIIIPSEYSFGLPLIDEETGLRLEDCEFKASANSSYTIIVNNNQYKVYKFNENTKFINSILPQNQLLNPNQ